MIIEETMENMSKEGLFRYQIRNRKTGELMVEEEVSFGSEEYPFPEDYTNSGMALKALWEYEEEFIRKYFDISYEQIKDE